MRSAAVVSGSSTAARRKDSNEVYGSMLINRLSVVDRAETFESVLGNELGFNYRIIKS